MAKTAVLGFPRIGRNRELKKALEKYWKGESDYQALEETARLLRADHWRLMQKSGIDIIPSNDFSFYDQVLDTTCMTGAVPERYKYSGGNIDPELYFAMARGGIIAGQNVPAMEMTKWFDTNYHYLVPEFKKDQKFLLASLKAVNEFEEAKAMGIHTRPVLIGPITYLLSGRMIDTSSSCFDLLDEILPVYEEIFDRLAAAGADQIQMDEPCLVWDGKTEIAQALIKTYTKLSAVNPGLKIQLTTYFGDVIYYLDAIKQCPVDGLHIDLVRAPEQIDAVLNSLGPDKKISLGLIDGRNIWRADMERLIPLIGKTIAMHGRERTVISSSCSLLHVPFGLDDEKDMDKNIKDWLAFAKEKILEIAFLNRFANEGPEAIFEDIKIHQMAIQARRSSNKVHKQQVKTRCAQVEEKMLMRNSAFSIRKQAQQERLDLPLLPTTTIGSFPQTPEVRAKRREFKSGRISEQEYNEFLKNETRRCIDIQEKLGLDVLVHGEFERNDMVEYFGENLEGFIFTQNGWVQSYGSRCVKPPVIYGDIERISPMTLEWSCFAQSITKKIMKGMLTGPVTILQWSFVRDDQPRENTCQQIALAIRDEVLDLEKSGISVIQIDEPALREGLPLKKAEWEKYLRWGVDCFRLSASGVSDSTQIHTHMCYGNFEDILPAIAALDADVISIEASRSDMTLLKAFGDFAYPNDIGPGVYDIHSPLVPETQAIVEIMKKAMQVIPADRLWINPDCGLKTRNWPEVDQALRNMVTAAKILRADAVIVS